jgi:uncharacterized protein (DUF1015 family)
MADVRPFKGVRYDPQTINDLASVICPPYDIINPEQQDALYQRNEFNFVRIEFNRELPQDTPGDNRYTRSATNIKKWLERGVLKTESQPAIYVHHHYFNCGGKQYRRRNVIACVKLEEWEKMVIRPHENVLPKAKSDRLSMLWACQANTSPILAMYEDRKKEVAALLAKEEKNRPVIDIVDDCGERHRVWAIVRPEVISGIRQSLAQTPFYIADGHHRYDSALTYRREKNAHTASVSGEEAYNLVMMSLVDFADEGLVILPPHRLVRGIPRSIFNGLGDQLKVFFDVEELPLNAPDIWQKLDTRLTGMTPDMKEVKLALYGHEPGSIAVLTLRDFEAVNRLMPSFHSELYKRLDVSLVDHIILEKLLGISKEEEEKVLAYTYDRKDAINRVIDQQYQLVFLLNPVKPELIQAIADAGDRMPRKSTYFYPKSPAGLVFYRW